MKSLRKQVITNKTNLLLLVLILSMALLFCINTVSAAPGDTIYVNGSSGNDSWDGLSAIYNSTSGSGPKLSIKNATGTVNANGIINIADGTYTGVNNTNILIYKNMVIVGQSKTGTIIDAQNSGRIFYTPYRTGFDLSLINLTLRNGNSGVSSGGAIYDDNGWDAHSTLNITNCTFENNHNNNWGGAIYAFNVVLNIINSSFTGNTARVNGGAIAFGGDESVTMNVTGSTFTGNTVANGGAIYNGGNLTVNGSTFTSNSANMGGAIYSPGTLTVNDSSFTSNHATNSYPNGYGGAIHSSGNLNVTGSIFTGNTAGHAGGAVSVISGAFNVTGSTFTENVAVFGGAIYNWYVPIVVHFNRFYNNDATGINTGDAVRTDGTTTSTADVKYNWWGSNNPDFSSLISGNANHTPWIFMTINANPTTIENGETSLITVSFNNLFNGETVTPLDPATGHIPDGTPVTFSTDKGSIGCKTIEKETCNGIATATLTADETAGVAHINAVTDSQTVNTEVIITAKSGLYLIVTPSKANPTVGDTVVYTLKVGNKGPDTAKDVVMTYVVPEGLEFAGANVDVGTYTYDPTTRTVTWIIGDVPVGDPYMWLSLRVAQSGHYLINPVLSTSTYDPTLNVDTQSITVNAATKAAAKTIPMQETGLPIAGLLLAIMAVVGGLSLSKRK